ncbi:hypothetical protein ACFQZX_12125 [Mucilaginibacter litoreus]|uniref:Universal stress protein family protein n=1 Tax=Mucilaginibacter litoreus TaxID=1048221 RepID=A0ABW3ATJ8_9SPHI
MKNILIPTDYQAASLDCLHAICNHFKNEQLNLVLVHVFKLSDSITDVLMLSRRSREYEQIEDEFYERCSLLRVQYPQIVSTKIEFLYGSTLSMFKNFIEHNEIDAVADTSHCQHHQIHRSSIDPSVLIKKSGLPVIDTANRTNAHVKRAALQTPAEEELTEV